MSNINEMVVRYIAAWNERDARGAESWSRKPGPRAASTSTRIDAPTAMTASTR